MPPLSILSKSSILIEAAYALVLIITSLVIYFKTSEISRLSQHKGVKYFRLTFLFIAISYLLRSILTIFKILIGRSFFDFRGFMKFPMLLITYFSMLAFLYLIHSLIWKEYEHPDKIATVLHVIAFIIAVFTFMLGRKGFFIFFLVQLLILILVIIVSIRKHNNNKKKRKGLSQFYIIYILFFASWLINIIATFLLQSISFILGGAIYVVSLLLLILVMIKIIRLTG